MPDVKIDTDHWFTLRRFGNCYLPQLVDAMSDHDLSGADLRNQADKAKVERIAPALMNKVITYQGITHSRAADLIACYGVLRQTRAHLPELKVEGIVCAAFGLPTLAEEMRKRSLDATALAQRSGVSTKAVEHASAKGRVTGAIALSLLRALPDAPPLEGFIFTNPKESLGKLRFEGSPFTKADLHLPIPAGAPEVWP